PGKIDLGVGVYRDTMGRTPVMRAVKAAEQYLRRWICRLDELSTETQGAASTGCLKADKALIKIWRFSEDDRLQEAHELQITFRA
ncbi:hypothetical protein AB9E13_34405, partial [Rhizobium leguminosarum]